MSGRARTRTRRWLALVAVLGFTATALTTATASGAAPPSSVPPPQAVKPAACDPSRPGVTHHANGADSEQTGFVPCLTYGYFGFGEANLVVTKSGTVIYGGAYDPERGNNEVGFEVAGSIVRSANKGKSWDFVKLPPSPGSGSAGAGDPRLWLDPATGRVWFTKIGSNPVPDAPDAMLCDTEIFYSDDGGQTWIDHPNYPDQPFFGCPAFDFPHLFTAPRTTSAPAPQGAYPDVVYLCKSGTGTCWKSLDSGAQWTQVPNLSTNARRGTGGLDGTIYGIAANRLRYSTDEGATFTTAAGILSFTPSADIAVDRDGNIYVVGTVSGKPVVSYTTDKGATWSTPVAVQMPGVNHIHRPTIAVPRLGAPGRVAVAYIGNGDTSDTPGVSGYVGGPHHGYITTTNDIFAADPVFRSVQVDRDDDALLPLGFNIGGSTTTPSRGDYIGVYIDDTGNPWAYFYKDCPTADACAVHNPHEEWTNWLGAVATVAHKGFGHVPGSQ